MLSEKQEIVLEEIIKYINKNKISPTVRELAEIVGFKSSSTIHGYLKRLKDKGYIGENTKVPRTICVIKKPERKLKDPV